MGRPRTVGKLLRAEFDDRQVAAGTAVVAIGPTADANGSIADAPALAQAPEGQDLGVLGLVPQSDGGGALAGRWRPGVREVQVGFGMDGELEQVVVDDRAGGAGSVATARPGAMPATRLGRRASRTTRRDIGDPLQLGRNEAMDLGLRLRAHHALSDAPRRVICAAGIPASQESRSNQL